MAFLKFLIISAGLFLTESLAEPVVWKQVSASEALLRQPEPVGLEGNGTIHTFICRAYNVYSMIPGRLVLDNGTVVCKNSFNGGEAAFSEFEILDIPTGVSSWIPFSGEVPPNAILAGRQWSGGPSYLCRIWHESNLIVGALDIENCWFGYDGDELKTTENIEILVLNHYGVALGLTVS